MSGNRLSSNYGSANQLLRSPGHIDPYVIDCHRWRPDSGRTSKRAGRDVPGHLHGRRATRDSAEFTPRGDCVVYPT